MRLFLCGDLMLARGIDQILPYPTDPTLHEPYVRDARRYVELAEEVNGPIPRSTDYAYIWGDMLPVLSETEPDFIIGNLETAVTDAGDFAAGKSIHYRMSPRNLAVLHTAGFDCVSLANNHILDFGTAGLAETLHHLDEEDLGYCGSGHDKPEATSPWTARSSAGTDLRVFGLGHRSSGIPKSWAAGPHAPGVWTGAGIADIIATVSAPTGQTPSRRTEETMDRRRPFGPETLKPSMQRQPAPGVHVLSVHWGENWGYHIPPRRREAARAFIDNAGVTIVHGHSSHHPQGIELHGGALILYGCGDLLNDYEGIGDHEQYRPDLTAAYVVDVDDATLRVTSVTAIPFRIRRFRLERAHPGDAVWLARTLERSSPSRTVRTGVTNHDTIEVRPS
ncbi:MAG: CapA family protein [Spirochaetaceae bacterium]